MGNVAGTIPAHCYRKFGGTRAQLPEHNLRAAFEVSCCWELVASGAVGTEGNMIT